MTPNPYNEDHLVEQPFLVPSPSCSGTTPSRSPVKTNPGLSLEVLKRGTC